jgi:hypothetical protein
VDDNEGLYNEPSAVSKANMSVGNVSTNRIKDDLSLSHAVEQNIFADVNLQDGGADAETGYLEAGPVGVPVGDGYNDDGEGQYFDIDGGRD